MPSWPRPSRRAPRGVVVSDPAAVTATDLPVIVVEDTLRRPAGGRSRDPASRGIDGGGHHRQRRQDHDQGNHGDAARPPVHDLSQPRQPEQPHRLAAVAVRTAYRAAVRGHGTRHERRRRDQPARVDRRTDRCASGPTSARHTSASSRRSTTSRWPSRRSSKAPAADDVFVANAGDPRVIARAAGFAGDGRHVRRRRSGRRDRRCASSRAASTGRRRRCRCAATYTRSRPACSAAPISPTSPPHPPWRCVAGIPADEIVAGVADLVPASHRGEVVRAPGGWVVIDDAYNSSPSALTRALQTLASVPGRHVAMLGEMLELGDFSAQLPRRMRQGGRRTRRRA